MGKLLGAHSDEQELDRPDLNKCPDCGCFFPQSNCPLCGMECPEHMRAGNRAPVKPTKKSRGCYSNRVVFVNWYHSWWFIALMMLWMPLIGIILLITSPHSRNAKIAFTAVGVVLLVISTFGFSGIVSRITNMWEKPVDTSLTRAEYISECENVEPEEYYRSADTYDGAFVSLELKVISKITNCDAEYEGDKYPTYYICTDTSGGDFEILVRSCLVDSQLNFIPGDVIMVYGEGAGNCTVMDDVDYINHSAPCIYMAYAEISE